MTDKDEFDFEIEDAPYLVEDDEDDDNKQNFQKQDEYQSIPNPPSAASINHERLTEDEKEKTDVDFIKQPADSFGSDMDDDEVDMILSQIDENEIVKSLENAVKKSKMPEINRPSEPKTELFCQQSVIKPTAIVVLSKDESISSTFNESENKKALLRTKSPAKRTLIDSETHSFFLSQSQPVHNEGTPAKRSFPGPAGLLPTMPKERHESWNVKSFFSPMKKSRCDLECSSARPEPKSKDVSDISSSLSKGPWKMMLRHLNLNLKDDDSLLNCINIGRLWKAKSKGKTSKVKVANWERIPFLAVVVKEPLNYQNKMGTVVITLMDPTGLIKGVLSPTFMEAYGDLISPGTALVLRNCLVQTFRHNANLIITKKDVLCLATNKSASDDDDHEDENLAVVRQHYNDGSDLGEYPITLFENGVILKQQFPFSVDLIIREYSSLIDQLKKKNAKKEMDDYENKNIRQHYNVLNNQSNSELFSVVTTSTPKISEVSGDFEDEDGDDELFLRALQNCEFQIEEESL